MNANVCNYHVFEARVKSWRLPPLYLQQIWAWFAVSGQPSVIALSYVSPGRFSNDLVLSPALITLSGGQFERQHRELDCLLFESWSREAEEL